MAVDCGFAIRGFKSRQVPFFNIYIKQKTYIMNKMLGPRMKHMRRLGIFPSITSKRSLERTKSPGQHGVFLSTKQSKDSSSKFDFYNRLIEKQKLRRAYVLSESELKNIVKRIFKNTNKKGMYDVLAFVESRLDVIVWRLGMAKTVLMARQLINHKSVHVNNKIITFAGYICKTGDFIEINNKSKIFKFAHANCLVKNSNLIALNSVPKTIDSLQYKFNVLMPKHLKLDVYHYKVVGEIVDTITADSAISFADNIKVSEYYTRY